MRLPVSMALMSLIAGAAGAQPDQSPGSRTVLGVPVNESLAAGSKSIDAGDYDRGIEQTLLGLRDRGLSASERSAGLSNLCAAHAGKRQPETAVRYCTESLSLMPENWRALSNRSYAYWIMGRYPEAQADLDAASAINPRARQIAQIRGMINERTLQPSVVMEDLQ